MGQVDLDNALAGGREAVRRYAWRDAYELFKAADQGKSLDADDLEGLAEAAWWNGRSDECISARERAFALHMAADRPRRAARIALALAKDHFAHRASAVGKAWINRTQRLLDDQPDVVERGYLIRLQAMLALGGEAYDEALNLARQTLEIGTRFGDRDLIALALQDQGQVYVARGQVKEGMALIDEATVAALSGELTPYTTGAIYCNLIGVCEEMADYGRAGEWTDAARRWCERTAIAGFPGMCRVHRAGVIQFHGDWREAEIEARNAFDELRHFNVGYAAEAQYLIGENRLYRGDLAEAREAFEQAHQLGRDPNPGLALLQLEEGNVQAAAAGIRRGLSATTQPLPRARLLSAQVTIGLAAGDFSTAQAAVTELSETARTYSTSALRAQALLAQGLLSLASDEHEGAVRSLCEALILWREVGAPYEEARTRVALGSAYRAGGDADGATLELQAARSAFTRLGAVLDERRVMQLLGEAVERPAQAAAGDFETRTFMFTDIVKSTELVGAIGDAAWNDLLHWHDQTLRTLIARHGGEEISQTGDGYFAGFRDSAGAIECAVQIQRTLAGHRREHGFAVPVRIGLHQAAATRVGLDYRGKGVHEAARIGATAQGGEILASWHTAQPCKYATSDPRPVNLKGITEPVQVVSVSWR